MICPNLCSMQNYFRPTNIWLLDLIPVRVEYGNNSLLIATAQTDKIIMGEWFAQVLTPSLSSLLTIMVVLTTFFFSRYLIIGQWIGRSRFMLFLGSLDWNVECKLVTVVEDDQKVPFSIATTPRYRGGCYSFPWIAPLYPWSVPHNAEC